MRVDSHTLLTRTQMYFTYSTRMCLYPSTAFILGQDQPKLFLLFSFTHTHTYYPPPSFPRHRLRAALPLANTPKHYVASQARDPSLPRSHAACDLRMLGCTAPQQCHQTYCRLVELSSKANALPTTNERCSLQCSLQCSLRCSLRCSLPTLTCSLPANKHNPTLAIARGIASGFATLAPKNCFAPNPPRAGSYYLAGLPAGYLPARPYLILLFTIYYLLLQKQNNKNNKNKTKQNKI